jgi:hypothetical protein
MNIGDIVHALESESVCGVTRSFRQLAQLLSPQERADLINHLLEAKQTSYAVLEAALIFSAIWGDAKTVGIIQKTVSSSENETVKECALISFAKLSGAESVPFLREYLYSPIMRWRVAAMKATLALPKAVGIEVLRQILLEHPDQETRFLAALYLAYRRVADGRSMLKDHLVQAPEGALHPESKSVGAICALSLLGDDEAKASLRTLVAENESPGKPKRRLALFIMAMLLELPEDSDIERQVVEWIEYGRCPGPKGT